MSVKAVKFAYEPSADVHGLRETFRQMCNDAIHIALTEKPEGKFELTRISYRRLKEYGLHTHYILSACEVAYSVYSNRSRKSHPYIRRSFLKLDN
jgi:hypothetical protein